MAERLAKKEKIMWLLITFITLWAITPGPVFIMTIQETRKHGLRAGVAISAGATLTSALMVIAALFIHLSGLSAALEASNMLIIEQVGAVGIILFGIYAGYKCFSVIRDEPDDDLPQNHTRGSFAQGVVLMMTSIPQALVFYNVIMPQTLELSKMTSTIMGLGTLKVPMIFGFHAGVALISGRSQSVFGNVRIKKGLDFSLALLLVGMGVNILF